MLCFFFPGPLTVNTLHGRDLPCHLAQKRVKATCHPYLLQQFSGTWEVCQQAGTQPWKISPSPFPLSFGADTSSRCQFLRPLPATCTLWLVPLVRSFPVVPCLPCTARRHQHRQARKQPWKAGSSIERAFLFQEVTAAVVVPAIRRAHIKHATPHPHTRQGYARLHARPRLPVGPRIAIPACGLACTRDRPGTVSQRLNVPAQLTGVRLPLGNSWEFPGGQRGLLHGLRMAARLFRLGRILCTPPRELQRIARRVSRQIPSSMVPLLLLRCRLLAFIVPMAKRPRL